MPNRFARLGILSVAAVALVAAGGPAMGQKAKKMNYEQAFAKCKQEIGASAPGNESLSTSQRTTAAGACMKKYGFRLKK